MEDGKILASAKRCIAVLTGRLLCASKWETSLVRGDHNELLCCKPSLLGVFEALASEYWLRVLTFCRSLVTGVSSEGAFCDL